MKPATMRTVFWWRQPEIQRFITLLESLPTVQDVQPAGDRVSNVLPLAREYGLSAYDAAYLELSIGRGAPLATLDGKLRKAAQKWGAESSPENQPEVGFQKTEEARRMQWERALRTPLLGEFIERLHQPRPAVSPTSTAP